MHGYVAAPPLRARFSGCMAAGFVAVVAAIVAAGPTHAAVTARIGPTSIIDGEAKAAGDITVQNQKLAFALAVDTPVPYGVPRGALIDIAAVSKGVAGRDRAVFADFIPNNWSAWPNTYQHMDILERGPQRVVVRAVRDWGQVVITTLYTLVDDADRVEIETTMRNDGPAALPDLLSGLTYWPKGGYLFGVPGASGNGPAAGKLADRMVAYDEDWSVALHAAYFDHAEYGSKDLYLKHTLAPGASRRFTAALQVGASGDLAPVMRAEIERQQLASGSVEGTLAGADGKPVEQGLVVVEKDGKPYGWALAAKGRYRLDLPAGDYALYATGKGYTQSARQLVTLRAHVHEQRDFGQLQGPGTIRFVVSGGTGDDAHAVGVGAGRGDAVTGGDGGNGVDTRGHEKGPSPAMLDARIEITKGQQPLVEFLGKKTFFTQLDDRGVSEVALAPGDYTFSVSSGGGFLRPDASVALHVAAGQAQTAAVQLPLFAAPPLRGWYAADTHHHADQAEAVTPPADLARAQLAAGLDFLFVSDHDTMTNLAQMERIAARRGVPFIGSMELSASWAHFNAYPLAAGQTLGIDVGTATVQQIFAEARRLGAATIQVNHPYIPYGYFASVAAKVAPGGWDPGFNVVEINAAAPGDDVKVLKALWADWNEGKAYYLSGGTDVHDVWNDHSGRVRIYAHIAGKPTPAAFSAALNAGHAYVTAGPLIYPDTPFGETLAVRAGQPLALGFDLQSLAGLRRVDLVADGVVVESKSYADFPQTRRLEFMPATRARWYALVVEDRTGHKAYTNPIWVGQKN